MISREYPLMKSGMQLTARLVRAHGSGFDAIEIHTHLLSNDMDRNGSTIESSDLRGILVYRLQVP